MPRLVEWNLISEMEYETVSWAIRCILSYFLWRLVGDPFSVQVTSVQLYPWLVWTNYCSWPITIFSSISDVHYWPRIQLVLTRVVAAGVRDLGIRWYSRGTQGQVQCVSITYHFLVADLVASALLDRILSGTASGVAHRVSEKTNHNRICFFTWLALYR